jgi:putative PIN family toxin of toxin-antitoxin system
LKRVVFDTNTLISGLLWDGNESIVIEKAEIKAIKLFISHQMLEELAGVLKRKKFTKKLEGKEYTIEKAIAKIALISTLIEPNININEIKEDLADNRVLECAISCKADFIVSGDKHLLNLKEYEGIKIIKAAEFISHLSN